MLMGLFMIIPVFSYYQEEVFFQLVKILNYFLPYMIGYNVYIASEDKEKTIKNSLFAIYIGYSAYVSATYFYNLYRGFNKSVISNFWGGGYVAGTLVSLLCTYVSAYSISALFHSKNLAMKIFAIYNLLIVLLLNAQSGTRSSFLILVAIFILIFLFSINEKDFSKIVKRIFGILFAVISISIIYSRNLFGIKNMVLESNIFERFNRVGFETGRIDLSRKYFEIMFKYPFGGGNGYKEIGNYAHNLWQDCYDDYGFIVAFFLVMISLSFFKRFLKLIFITDKTSLEFLLVCIYGAVLIQFCLEPILNGYPMLFWNMIYIHGLITNYYEEKKESGFKRGIDNENSIYI